MRRILNKILSLDKVIRCILIYIILAFMYQIISHSPILERYGYQQEACTGQISVSIPKRLPRSPHSNQRLLPTRRALLQAPPSIQPIPDGSFFVETVEPKDGLYALWAPPEIRDSQVTLLLRNCKEKGQASKIELEVESLFEYYCKTILALLFDIPIITGSITLAGLLHFLWNYHQEQEERCTRLRTSLDELLKAAPDQLGMRYFEEWKEKVFHLRRCMESWWNPVWAALEESKRRDIMRPLKIKVLQTWLQNRDKAKKAQIVQEDLNMLRRALGNVATSWVEQIEPWLQVRELREDHLQQAPRLMETFEAIPELFPVVAQALKQEVQDEEKWKELLKHWVKEYSLVGYFFVRRIGDELQKMTQEDGHQKSVPLKDLFDQTLENPPHPNLVTGHLALWPEVEIPPIRLKADNETLEVPTPFGPEKAELDPRLPLPLASQQGKLTGLCWDGHPAWTKIHKEEHTWFRVPPGCGTSALIWMGRYNYRYWGGKGPAFSFYLHLQGEASLERGRALLRKALADAVAYNLIEDPLWFLSADDLHRRHIVSWMCSVYGGVEEVLPLLEHGGLGGLHSLGHMVEMEFRAYKDARVPSLEEALQSIQEAMARFGSRKLRGPFRVLLFVEIPSEQPTSNAWVQLLEEWPELWTLGRVKVFVGEDMALPVPLARTLPIQEVKVEWSKQQLQNLIQHRWTQILNRMGVSPKNINRLLAAHMGLKEVDSSEEIAKTLVKASRARCPKELMKWGNHRLAQQ